MQSPLSAVVVGTGTVVVEVVGITVVGALKQSVLNALPDNADVI